MSLKELLYDMRESIEDERWFEIPPEKTLDLANYIRGLENTIIQLQGVAKTAKFLIDELYREGSAHDGAAARWETVEEAWMWAWQMAHTSHPKAVFDQISRAQEEEGT